MDPRSDQTGRAPPRPLGVSALVARVTTEPDSWLVAVTIDPSVTATVTINGLPLVTTGGPLRLPPPATHRGAPAAPTPHGGTDRASPGTNQAEPPPSPLPPTLPPPRPLLALQLGAPGPSCAPAAPLAAGSAALPAPGGGVAVGAGVSQTPGRRATRPATDVSALATPPASVANERKRRASAPDLHPMGPAEDGPYANVVRLANAAVEHFRPRVYWEERGGTVVGPSIGLAPGLTPYPFSDLLGCEPTVEAYRQLGPGLWTLPPRPADPAVLAVTLGKYVHLVKQLDSGFKDLVRLAAAEALALGRGPARLEAEQCHRACQTLAAELAAAARAMREVGPREWVNSGLVHGPRVAGIADPWAPYAHPESPRSTLSIGRHTRLPSLTTPHRIGHDTTFYATTSIVTYGSYLAGELRPPLTPLSLSRCIPDVARGASALRL